MDIQDETRRAKLLIAHGEDPFNAEPPLPLLLEHNVTPVELVYCRNHCPVKEIDSETYKLTVDGMVENNMELTLADVKSQFPKIEVVAALQCAGNRRKHMQDKKKKPVEGVLWGEGTIANVRWGGARLRDILAAAKVKHGDTASTKTSMFVSFSTPIAACEDDDWYGASIPLEKAMDELGDALLAYEMNGLPLAPDHGYPFRVVVPGFSAARWVKWVKRMTVSEHECDNFYQQRDYKILPPHVETQEMADGESWWSKVPPIQENHLNSVIGIAELRAQSASSSASSSAASSNGAAAHMFTSRTNGGTDASGNDNGHGISLTHRHSRLLPLHGPKELYIKGYATSSPAAPISRIEVSLDKGPSKTWHPATITYKEGKWSWVLWEACLPVPEDGNGQALGGAGGTVYSRAVDENGEEQRSGEEVQWNLRGMGYDGYGEKEF